MAEEPSNANDALDPAAPDQGPDQAIEITPEEQEKIALFQLMETAMTAANENQYDKAIDLCHEAVKLAPEAAEPYFLLGVIAYICKDEGQAISMCETAHRVSPDTAEYAQALATIYTSVGQLADGLYYAKLYPSLEPHPLFSQRMPANLRNLKKAFDSAAPSGHFIEAQRLFNIAHYEGALKECLAEVRLNPENPALYILLGRTAIILRRFTQAVGALQAAVQLDPDLPMASGLLARALVGLGRYEEASEAARRAIRHETPDPEAFYQAMSALQSCPSVSLDELKTLTRTFSDRLETEEFGNEGYEADPDEPCRVGFLSNRLFRKPGHELFDFWFALPEDNSASYFGFQQSVHTDIVTTSVKNGCQEWREIYDLDPFTLTYIVQEEAIDVLVDLSGPDAETRNTLLANRPAPAIVGAFGLPEPGLLPGITHILSDEVLSAVDKETLLPGQECLAIPGTLFAHEPFSNLPAVERTPARSNDRITFGGIAESTLLTPQCASLWADVLAAVPNSKLLLCGAETLSDDNRLMVRELFSNAGVADLILLPQPGGGSDMEGEEPSDIATELEDLAPVKPAQLREVDILLDTAPYSCRQELTQALWMGVPVVSLRHPRRPGMVGASILSAAGRVSWIADDRASFVRTAAALANDLDVLDKERGSLRESIADSLLFDRRETARHVRQVLARVGKDRRSQRGTE